MTLAELGDIRSEHLGRNKEGWIGAPVIAILGGAIVVASGGQPWLIVMPVGVGLLWLAATTGWTPRKILIRDDGIEIHRLFRQPICLRFSDCRCIFREWTVQTTVVGTGVTDYTLKLVDDQNRVIRLSPRSIKDHEHFFTRIERLLIFPRNQQLRDSFDAGGEVAFGKITISTQGLQIGGRVATWDEIREVELSPKLLIFRFHRGLRRTFRVGRIPFPWALISIVKSQGVRLKFFDGFKAA
jgi:hypothetical protein